jgi:hypothetical protein
MAGKDNVSVYLKNATSAAYENARIEMSDRGLWVQENDETWTFRPWHAITKLAGFSSARRTGAK